MKKFIIQFIALFLFCSSTSLFSQFYQYVEQNSGVTVNLTSSCVDFNNDTYLIEFGWACGNSGTVIKTTNNGNNWINVSGNGIPSNVNLVNIFAIDSTACMTAGNIGANTYLYRTSNKGATWAQVFSQLNGAINAVVMSNASTGIMAGNPVNGRWSLWKTINGGVSWDSLGLMLVQAGSETGFNNSLSVVNNMVWFGTNNSRIYYSTNLGTNWQILSTPEVNSRAVWFYCNDGSSGLFGGTNIYKTSNYGVNWTALTCPGTGNFGGFTWGDVSVYQQMLPYLMGAVRNDSVIYVYQTYSGNWLAGYYAPSGVYRYVSNVYHYFNPYSWAVRSNGGITRITVFIGEAKKLSSAIPDKFSLLQNYPNPFNPTTKIQYQIKKTDFVQLKLYDILGHEVTSLVNERETPGTYEVEFNASNYPSGVYFYKLITTDFTDVKKLVLIK